MKDLTALVDQAVAKVNGIIAKDIAAINEAMKSSPRIAVESDQVAAERAGGGDCPPAPYCLS